MNKRQFNFGDRVICVKFDVSQNVCIGVTGFSFKNTVNDTFFNREAIIINTYKESMDKFHGVTNTEDKDEYEIQFVDDRTTLAWVDSNDLIPVYPV